MKRITNHPELWQRMDTAFQVQGEDFKKRKDDVEKKIIILRQTRHFWELVQQFKENTVLEAKKKLLVELQSASKESPAILGAEEAIKAARMGCIQLQWFLLQLQNLARKENQYTALQLLEQRYQKLTEDERQGYASQLIKAKESVCQFYLEKINTATTIDERKANFSVFSELFKKLPVEAQETFKVKHEVKQKEHSLFELYDQLEKAILINEKQFLFNSELFSTTISNFENLSGDLTSECAKRVYRQITKAKVIYGNLLDIGVINQASSSQSVDTLLNQMEPILDNINSGLRNQLIAACLQDETLKKVILEKVTKKKFTSILIEDLLTFKKFRDQKIELSEKNNFGSKYDKSINQFYAKSLEIRLSGDPLKMQIAHILQTAKTEFKHRDEDDRLWADVIMVASIVGMLIGVGRLALGKTFFFSDAKTGREKELEDDWLVERLPKDDSDVRLITAPAA